MRISERTKEELKIPLGEVTVDFNKIKELSKEFEFITIGDICTLAFLNENIDIKLAVFDFKTKRKDLEPKLIEILKSRFPDYYSLKNEKGTISKYIIQNAQKLIQRKGSILIEGEEDLTALAFILAAKEKEIVVYGQPDSGMVLVFPNKKTKERISLLLNFLS